MEIGNKRYNISGTMAKAADYKEVPMGVVLEEQLRYGETSPENS